MREKLIAALADELNAYLNEDYGIGAWNVLLYEWARIFLFTLYDKFLTIRQVIEGSINADVMVYDTELPAVCSDYAEFTKEVSDSDEYILYQYSLILNYMDEAKGHLTYYNIGDYSPDRNSDAQYSKESLRHIVKTTIVNMMRYIYANKKQDWRHTVALASDSGLSLRSMRDRVVPLVSGYMKDRQSIFANIGLDEDFRKTALKADCNEDEFTTIVFNLARRELPVIYAEKHASLKKMSIKRYGNVIRAGKLIHGANTIHSDEELKLVCAIIRDSGGHICTVQHGGNYGVEKTWHYDDEFELSDTYYVGGRWGLGDGFGCDFRNMPFLKYRGRKYGKCPNAGKILYVTYSFGRYLHRPMRSEMNVCADILNERRFLGNISPSVRRNLNVRLYPYTYGWETKEQLEDEIEGIQFDDEPVFEKSLSQADFIIISNWQTTFNEAIFADRPCIFLRDLSYLRDEAEPDIEELHNIGICCYTWEELLERTEELFGRWDEWWSEPERQAVVGRIRNKYAWYPANAKELWEQEIKRLCNE